MKAISRSKTFPSSIPLRQLPQVCAPCTRKTSFTITRSHFNEKLAAPPLLFIPVTGKVVTRQRSQQRSLASLKTKKRYEIMLLCSMLLYNLASLASNLANGFVRECFVDIRNRSPRCLVFSQVRDSSDTSLKLSCIRERRQYVGSHSSVMFTYAVFPIP